MLKSNLILGDKPNAVANLKITSVKTDVYFLDNKYLSLITFALAYRDNGLST